MKNNYSWLRLDNSAKIYPMMVQRDTQNLFRLSLELKEDIDAEKLQKAVNMTLPRFPSISVRLMRGMFWYYFEKNDAEVIVKEESDVIMEKITDTNCNGYCFRVEYYKKRITMEFFHVVCDGTGAMEFYKSVIYSYFSLKGYEIDTEGRVLTVNSPIRPEELEDSFVANYKPLKFKDLKIKNLTGNHLAYTLHGVPFKYNGKGMIIIDLDSNKVRAFCKEQGYTVTAFLGGLMLYSVYKTKTKECLNKYLAIFCPINLRKIYGSITLRNFTMFARAEKMVDREDLELKDFIDVMTEGLLLANNKPLLDNAISTTVRGEKLPILRLTPLVLKDFGFRAYNKLFPKVKKTATFSNLGLIDFPNSMQQYISKFYFAINVSKKIPVSMTACSTYNNLNVTFTRNIQDTQMEKFFAKYLVQLGFDVKVSSNYWEVENAL